MPSKPVTYRALVGLNLADGKDENGDPVSVRVEAGEQVPAGYKIPKEWVGRKVEVV